ncbi:MAG: SDR family oxidoreductase [Paludibacteraceae bacterium]|nr:SDR family oxidoreductase [Paludibacteraceae bacterium]
MEYNPLTISGKTILISGAASGIGRQCAIDFSHAGANLVLLDINEEQLTDTRTLCSPNVKCSCYRCNLTEDSSMAELFQQIIAENGVIDGFLHCAGIEKTLPYNKFSTNDFAKIFDVNFIGAMNIIKQLSKKSHRGEYLKIVLIASITAIVGRPGVCAYAASKGAIVSAVKTLALEMAPKRININCISPGTILTPLMQNMLDTLTEEQKEERKSGFPLGLGMPTDVANAAMFLLSDGARWITGQNIVVDGGYTIR